MSTATHYENANFLRELAEFPRLYEADPRYGEGVRRISLAGQHVRSGLTGEL